MRVSGGTRTRDLLTHKQACCLCTTNTMGTYATLTGIEPATSWLTTRRASTALQGQGPRRPDVGSCGERRSRTPAGSRPPIRFRDGRPANPGLILQEDAGTHARQ